MRRRRRRRTLIFWFLHVLTWLDVFDWPQNKPNTVTLHAESYEDLEIRLCFHFF